MSASGAEGLLAQALEHETDHLNGILYIDRLVSQDSLRKIGYQPSDQDDGDNDDESPDAPAETTATSEKSENSDPGQ